MRKQRSQNPSGSKATQAKINEPSSATPAPSAKVKKPSRVAELQKAVANFKRNRNGQCEITLADTNGDELIFYCFTHKETWQSEFPFEPTTCPSAKKQTILAESMKG